jgi:hypothetical protein
VPAVTVHKIQATTYEKSIKFVTIRSDFYLDLDIPPTILRNPETM